MTIHDNHRQQQRELERVHTFLTAYQEIAAAEGHCIGSNIYVKDGFTPAQAKTHWPISTQASPNGGAIVNFVMWNVMLNIDPQPEPDPLPDEAAAAEHRACLHRLEAKLHELEAHPDWEYTSAMANSPFAVVDAKKQGWIENGSDPRQIFCLRRKLSPEQTKTQTTEKQQDNIK